MLVFAGLGNPGSSYAGNRHNIGFMAADAIARRHSFAPWTKKFQSLVAEGTLGGEKVLLVKPQSFMNASGQPVGEALRFHKLGPDALVVFHDELDLPEGRIRVKQGGGNGGHNGLRSLDAHLGKDYRRVRIGIGHPGNKDFVQRHVLGDFAKADRDWLDLLIEAIAEAAPSLIGDDGSRFMNKVSLATKQVADDVKPPKAESHIRQARQGKPAVDLPATGPMAAMLKKLLGKE